MNLLASLRYLVALNEHQHFGRASQACHITQPALSNALRALEEEFGTAIVKRGRTYAGLTTEGERVLASAQRMLHEREVLQQELDSAAARPQGRLSLGAVPTAMPIVARFAAMLQARHPGISPVVRAMSSPEIEVGLESLSLDLGLGYSDRIGQQGNRLAAVAQYTEHYFLVRRLEQPAGTEMPIGKQISWREASALPLCLLTPEMHNRTIVDSAFAMAGVEVKPAIETNSVLALALSVVAGGVCSILPGALVGAVRGYRELEALPLVGPEVLTPIGFMMVASERPSRTMQAALALARDEAWLAHAAAHSGLLGL
ncbi:MAG TPA: LysR substrate-binding domain-containing protein [Burkholderiaceae bacterium]|nr:LysR substrate-binding domain-containing protein [Burkholderiaceae bacterium]